MLTLALLLTSAGMPVCAQSAPQHFTEVEYDEVARLKALQTAVEESAPIVSSVVPAIVRRGPAVAMEVGGSGLRGAAVSGSDPGLMISAVTATATRVTFQLQADESVPLGIHTLRFTTVLGFAEFEVTLRPRLPRLLAVPNPSVLSPGASRPVTLSIDSPDVIDHSVSILSSNPAVLSVSPNLLSVTAGSLSLGNVTLNALAIGNAALRIDSEELRVVVVPVFVTAPYVPPPGGATFYSRLLGVQLNVQEPPVLISRGPFTARLGLLMPGAAGGGVATVAPLLSPVLGISLGPTAWRIQPGSVMRGEGAATVEVFGQGLGNVTTATLLPAESVAVSVTAVDGSGARVVLAVEPAANAALGERELRLSTAGGAQVPFSNRAAAGLHITGPLPQVDSVAPVLLVRGTASAVLSVRGERLAGASSVRVTPSDGIVVGATPTVNGSGTQLTVNYAVAADAPLGTRVVSVLTSSGESSTVAGAANTVQVVAALGPAVTPIVARALGVLVEGSTPVTQTVGLTSAPVGVSVGPSVWAIDPAAGTVGEAVSLDVFGNQLDAVSAVLIQPADGVEVGASNISGDGGRVTASLTIAADAVRGLRRIRLMTAAGEVPARQPGTTLFNITDPLPVIDSVSPLLLVRGAAPLSLSARGRNFSAATALRLLPGDGVALSAPVVSDAGRRVSVQASIEAGASVGQRVLVVDAPTGNSGETPSAANTVQIVDGLGAGVTPILSPSLGITLGSGGGSTPTPVLLTSPLLGVQVATPPSSPTITHFLPSARLGVAVGPVASAFTPPFLPAGQSALLRVEGVGLQTVTTVAFQPPEGINLDGPIEIVGDGMSLTAPLLIAADAAQTTRSLRLGNVVGNPVAFASSELSLARVVGSEPRIDSITPIQVTPNQTLTLTVRGGNLFGATAVTATPATGLTFGVTPSVNADGSQVTVSLTVAAGAPAGPRVIRVLASGGSTPEESVPANTLTVVTGQ